MNKIYILFVLLFLVGCNKEEVKTFNFNGEIQKIMVIGKGTNAHLDKQEVENTAEINVIEVAMEGATILSKSHTDEGPLYQLEVIYDDNSKEIINIWYYPNTNKGRFDSNNNMFSLNEEATSALIELIESYKK